MDFLKHLADRFGKPDDLQGLATETPTETRASESVAKNSPATINADQNVINGSKQEKEKGEENDIDGRKESPVPDALVAVGASVVQAKAAKFVSPHSKALKFAGSKASSNLERDGTATINGINSGVETTSTSATVPAATNKFVSPRAPEAVVRPANSNQTTASEPKGATTLDSASSFASPPTVTKQNPFLNDFDKEEEEEEVVAVKIVSPPITTTTKAARKMASTDFNIDADSSDSEDEEPTTPIATRHKKKKKKKSMPALKDKAEILEELESSESEDEESTNPKIARKKSTVRAAKAKTPTQKKATTSTNDTPVLEKKKPATRTTAKPAAKKAATPRTSTKKNNSNADSSSKKAKTPTPKKVTFSTNVTPVTAKKKAPPPTTTKPMLLVACFQPKS